MKRIRKRSWLKGASSALCLSVGMYLGIQCDNEIDDVFISKIVDALQQHETVKSIQEGQRIVEEINQLIDKYAELKMALD